MTKKRVEVDGRTAFVSGAASGMGRAVALRLAAHGCPVAIVDQNEDGLRETAELISGPVLARTPGRARPPGADGVRRRGGRVGADAAGHGAQQRRGGAPPRASPTARWRTTSGCSRSTLGGVINGTRAFLPILLRQDSGVIVNTSSVFGLVGIPFQSAYCTSKFAVRGFTESLRHELRGTGVRAVTIHPGGVKTNIARNARYHAHPMEPGLSHEEAATRFEAMCFTTPERAAKIIHEGVKAGRSRVLVGPDAYVFDALARLAPTRYFDVLALLEGLSARRGARSGGAPS